MLEKLRELVKQLPIKTLLDQLDVVSGAVLFIVAANVIGIFWYNALHHLSTDTNLVVWSLGIVGAKTTHGIMTNGKDDGNPPQPPVQP